MKIVVIGCGVIGSAVIRELCTEGHDIVAIEENRDILEKAINNFDIAGIEGNGASLEILREAGVDKADLVIATLPYDEVNVLSCLCAKKLGAKETIARIRTPEYADQIAFLGKDFALSMSINPELLATQEIVRILKFPSAEKVSLFANGRAELVELTIPEESKLIGLSLQEINQKYKTNVLCCVVEREDEAIVPRGDFILAEGDKITLTGKRADIVGFIRKFDLLKERIKKVMIVGGGIASYYLAKQLIETGMQVKLIDNDLEDAEHLSEQIPGLTVVLGEATDNRLLSEEGIENTDAIVCLTGSDEVNTMVSLYAKNKEVNKIITVVGKYSVKNILDETGLDTILVPKTLTANAIVRYVRSKANAKADNIVSLHKLGAGEIEALEFVASENSKVVGIPLSSLKIKQSVLLATVVKGKEVIIPNGNTVIDAGDTVIVITSEEGLDSLEDVLGA